MELKDGEIICPECNGTGYAKNKSEEIPEDEVRVADILCVRTCPKCFGAKKLDWVENIVGKKDIYSFILPKIINGEYPKLMAKELVDVQPMTGIKYPIGNSSEDAG